MSELSSRQLLEHNKTGRAASRKRDARLFALPGWLIALLIGLLVLIGVIPGTRGAGALCVLLSVGGCVWELNHWARIWRNQQRIAQSAQAHAVKKARRQARQTEQKDQQQQRKATQAHARRNKAQRDYAENEAQIDRAIRYMAEQDAHFREVMRETSRLQSLDAVAFRAEAEHIFAMRGLPLQKETVFNDDTLRLLRLPDNSLELALFAEDAAAIGVADVERLEHARQQTNATRAYLIGRGSFTAPALRLSVRFPMTCVEANLLAHWKFIAETE